MLWISSLLVDSSDCRLLRSAGMMGPSQSPGVGSSTDVAPNKEDETEQFLPEHTISMRKALSYCRNLVAEHASNDSTLVEARSILVTVDQEAAEAATSLVVHREKSLRCFWEQQCRDLQCCSDKSKRENGASIATIDVTPVENQETPSTPASTMDPVEFRKVFQNGNVPCRIRGLDKTRSFSSVCAKWRTLQEHTKESSKTRDAVTNATNTVVEVNRNWFLESLGKDSKVPVRFQESSCSQSDAALDEDGRAQECETIEMSLYEWIDLLDETQVSASSPCLSSTSSSWKDESNPNQPESYYLKDWHLQSTLRRSALDRISPVEAMQGNLSSCDTNGSLLYEVPAYFQYDLLNAFLTKFTDSGDYMFTYVSLNPRFYNGL